MENRDLTIAFSVDQSAEEVFTAARNVSGWWTENVKGKYEELNDEFEVRFGDVHYSRHRLTEVVPNKTIVWLVTDSALNFVEDKKEWTNTKIKFEISEKGDQTQLRFSHLGLLPQVECYEACSKAWTDYIQNSLRSYIVTGKGKPAPKEN